MSSERSVKKVSGHVIWKRDIYWRRYKRQGTLHIGQWHLSPLQSRHLGTSHSSPNRHQPPRRIFLNLISGLKSLAFKGDFSFGKSQELQGTKSGLKQGWVTWVIWCFAKNLCTRHDALTGMLSWWSCQSPVAHSCSLLNHPNSFCRGMFKLNAKFEQIRYSTRSVILNAMATQYTCLLNSMCHPHWLVQWSLHCSSMCIPVHSPWLLDYINVTQTTLIIVTMAGLFLDRPQMSYITILINVLLYMSYL